VDHLKFAMIELLGELTQYQNFLLGRVSVAHLQRNSIRSSAKMTRDQVKATSTSGGSYYDYDADRRDQIRAIAAHNENVQRLVEAGKLYKRCKHEYLEAGGPEDLLGVLIEMQAHE
jgi:hypothetical protein